MKTATIKLDPVLDSKGNVIPKHVLPSGEVIVKGHKPVRFDNIDEVPAILETLLKK